MSRHLIYVPALHSARPGLDLAAREAAWLRAEGIAEADVAVVEHRAGGTANNALALRRLAARHPQVRFLHVTPHSVADLVADPLHRVVASADTRALLHAALLPTAVSYGAGPNKAALTAAALGYEVLHRRDSDIESPDDDAELPVAAEVACILRRAGDVVAHCAPEAADQLNRIVYLVGTTYVGDPALDRRDLLAAGPEHAVALQRLKDLPDLSDRPADAEGFTRTYLAEQRPPAADTLALDTHRQTEMGVACYADVWRVLPELPLRDTLGSDYAAKSYLHDAEFPVVRHGRALRHAYRANRREPAPEQAADYALRDLRGLLLSRVRRRQRQRCNVWVQGAGSVTPAHVATYADALTDAWRMERPYLLDVPARAAGIYRRAADASTGAARGRLAATADAVAHAGWAAVADVGAGVTEFAALATVWPALIDAVATHRSMDDWATPEVAP